jgi:hypothetical protein
VPPDHFIRDGEEATVRTLRAFDTRLFADAPYPLVGARGGVAGLSRLAALEPTRVYIVASPKERPKQRDLALGRAELIDETHVLIHAAQPGWRCHDRIVPAGDQRFNWCMREQRPGYRSGSIPTLLEPIVEEARAR